MAECGRSDAFKCEDDIFRFHASLVAADAILFGRDTEGLFAVVAGSAGLSLFHLIHGNGFTAAGNHLAVVTALAGTAGLGEVDGVAEDCIAQPLDLIRYFTGFSLVAADAILSRCDTEGLDPGVTGAARLAFLHFGHGEAAALFQVEDGVVAGFAIRVFCQVKRVTENNRLCVLQGELDVLGFFRPGANDAEQNNRAGKQCKMISHEFHSSILNWIHFQAKHYTYGFVNRQS